MPKITDIKPSSDTTGNADDQRVRVFIDGQYCTSVRARTFKGMQENEGLGIGSEITCAALKEKDNFYWKQAYGADSWEKEKVRLNKVKNLIENISPEIEAMTVGFGADSTAFIERHPEMAGAPDLEVKLRHEDVVLLLVEVTGTESMRGDCYWVRPDKLKYADLHPDKDIWVILHYAKPVEKFVFIKPTSGKAYKYASITIRGADERMVEFRDGEPEVKTEGEFKAHLLARAKAGARTLIASLDWFTPNKTAFVEVYAASYLGAYAATNQVNEADQQPFDKALNLAVATWEKFNTFVAEGQPAQVQEPTAAHADVAPVEQPQTLPLAAVPVVPVAVPVAANTQQPQRPICIDCGEPFDPVSKNSVRCKPCWKVAQGYAKTA